MSESDSNEEDIPDAQACESLCNQFAHITRTDNALAMFYLQNKKWDLQLALNAYWQENPDTTSHSSEDTADKSEAKPHRIRLLSWNIDGLDTANLESRTEGVCQTICSEDADIVFLQEVTSQSVAIIEKLCTAYHVVTSGSDSYFTATLFKSDTVTYIDHEVKPFFSSKMGRGLLISRVKVKDISFVLANSHLESTAPHGEERKKQLKAAFKVMQRAPAESVVIFGGDLNLRDKELAELGGLPADVLDLWEETGRRPEAKYTWDTSRNDNTSMPGRFRPRCRFDRLFMRRSRSLKAVYFELVGLQRLPKCRRFPSDHWGILVHFNVV